MCSVCVCCDWILLKKLAHCEHSKQIDNGSFKLHPSSIAGSLCLCTISHSAAGHAPTRGSKPVSWSVHWTGTAKILNIWQYMIMLQWFMRQMIIDKHWNYVFLMVFADFWWCLCAYLMLIHNFRTRPLKSGWDVTVSSSLQRGIRRFYECGPGHSLKVRHACCKQQLVLHSFTLPGGYW